MQVLQALDVLLELARLAVGHEHHAVGALQHELARRLVVDLARHGVELELRREPRDLPRSSGRKSKNSVRSVCVASDTILPFAVVRHLPVDVVQVRRLPGPARSVVDDLAGDLAGRVVDE